MRNRMNGKNWERSRMMKRNTRGSVKMQKTVVRNRLEEED